MTKTLEALDAGDFTLWRYANGPIANWGYILTHKTNRGLWAIDPAWGVCRVIDDLEAQGYTLKGVLMTHTHYDHRNRLDKVLARSERLELHISLDEISFNTVVDQERCITYTEDATIELQGSSIKLIMTPGHTVGSVCYLVHDRLLTGDTLFIGGCGRVDLPGGDGATLYRSLQKMQQVFPDNTSIHPGHYYGDRKDSTIGEEKTTNPYLKVANETSFLAQREA